MSKLIFRFVFLLFALCYVPIVSAQSPVYVERYVQINGRNGVYSPSWLIEPSAFTACVILFSGGDGRVEISTDGIGKTGNFLIRSRYDFVANRLLVLIPDVASDQDDLIKKRTKPEHIRDVQAMIAWLRQHYPGKPVWLVGTSRGTISAAAVAATAAGPQADGIVLSATVTRPSHSGKDSIYTAAVDEIRTPTLLVHHVDDECYVTPFQDIAGLYNRLSNVTRKEIKEFRGGQSRGKPCQSKSYHGFNGIEAQVVTYISNWIK